ncbi:MAG: hypothetical protein IJ867_02790 [Clostridia bacterium]|nr:hypothetical protein [Clostridia bacterium]
MTNFFRKIKEKIYFLKARYNFFRKLEPGDIVWAKMPLSRKDMKLVELAHQTRPYLIVHKSRFYIYAFQSSSKKWNKAYSYQEYRINRFRYQIPKDSFITLKKVYKIPFWNVKSGYIHLQEIDLKNIQKRLQILDCKYGYPVSFRVDEGDVVQIQDQFYYVYAEDNTNLYCLIVYPKKPSNQYERIKINNKFFYTKFEKKAIFHRKEEMKMVNMAYSEERDWIAKQMKLYKRKKIKNA